MVVSGFGKYLKYENPPLRTGSRRIGDRDPYNITTRVYVHLGI